MDSERDVLDNGAAQHTNNQRAKADGASRLFNLVAYGALLVLITIVVLMLRRTE